MSLLFYCIYRHPGPRIAGLLGVGRQPVHQISHRSLAAAVSRIDSSELAPDLNRVRAYERVVNSCNRRGTVIPLRYGCVAAHENMVIELLDENEPHYESLLQELDGCVELGLRVLLPAANPGASAGSREIAGPPSAASPAPPQRLGLAYLTARKAHYAHQDRWTEEYRQISERCLARFAGLFVKHRMEAPSPRLPLLSLYFLTPCRAVETFRRAFRQLTETESARLLLSGPWPPYNFVVSRSGLI
ncbi:MAG: GvpL/GvpF family gas vesicle protein [Deltaproteobacteria bacterium]|nr:GvpL/GvpF family gas vesicle protein [Deltaproteobacteria bacterium]